jgi:hypothetical protein
VEAFAQLADADGDGQVTGYEYGELNARVNSEKLRAAHVEGPKDAEEENVATFKSRDGSIRSLSRREFDELVAQSETLQARIKGEDQSPLNDQQLGPNDAEKRRSLSEIALDDPDLAKFIAIVKWTVDQLKNTGTKFRGEVMQMRSLPPGGSNNRDKSIGNVAVDWGGTDHADIWLEFSVGVPGGEGSFYEAYLERNAAIYRRPYLAIKGAWALDAQGRRSKELPLPKPRMSRHPVGPGQVNQDEGEFKVLAIMPVIGLTMLCAWSVKNFVTEWFEVREAKARMALEKKEN